VKLKLDGVTAQQLIAIGQIMAGDTVTVSGVTGPDADTINGERVVVDDSNGASDADTINGEQSPKPEAGTPANSATGTVTPHHGSLIQSTTTQTEAVTPAPDATVVDTPPPPPAADPATTPTTVELAKGQNGQQIPWNARIHGKAKKTNADGTWRLIQGVNRETTVPTVEAELVAALAAAPNPAPVTDIPPPPVTAAAAAVLLASGAIPTTFAELLPLVTAAKAAGTLTDEQITAACSELGLAQFGLIATRPDLIPKAAQLLGVI